MLTEYIRSEAFVHRSVAGEHLLIALKRDVTSPMYMLTPTAAIIWDELAAWRTVRSLADRVVDLFEVDVDTAELDVRRYLEQLSTLGAVSEREVAE